MFYAFSTVDIVLGNSAFYFLALFMPIRKVGTLTQTRMRIGSLIVPDEGSICHNFVSTHKYCECCFLI